MNDKKIKKIINLAYEKVPYYKYFFSKPPLSIKEFPIINKDDIRKNGSQFISLNCPKENVVEEYTSGSTGIPLKIIKTNQEIVYMQKCLWGLRNSYLNNILQRRMLQFSFSDFGSNYVSNNKKTYHKCNLKKANMLTITLAKINESNIVEILKEISNFRPEWIRTSPSIFYEFCLQTIKNNSVEICIDALCDVVFIEFSGENLEDYMVEVIRSVYNGKIVNQYGSREVWPIAYTCSHGNLHICDSNVYFELVNTEKYCDDGKTGEVCITALEQFAFPFIRYCNGDIAKISNDTCSCGRKGYIESIEGRKNSVFTVDNHVYGATIFSRLISDLRKNNIANIGNYYVTQVSEYVFDFKCELLSANKLDYEKYIDDFLKKYINEKVKINIEIVKRIPKEFVGKQTYFYSKI